MYGASAGAINHVAGRLFGYTPVHIMRGGHDLFLVRSDVLHRRCAPASLPSFEELCANATVGVRFHRTCTPSDAAHLVDLPLELAGQHAAAHEKALRDVRTLNALHPHNPMCSLAR